MAQIAIMIVGVHFYLARTAGCSLLWYYVVWFESKQENKSGPVGAKRFASGNWQRHCACYNFKRKLCLLFRRHFSYAERGGGASGSQHCSRDAAKICAPEFVHQYKIKIKGWSVKRLLLGVLQICSTSSQMPLPKCALKQVQMIWI